MCVIAVLSTDVREGTATNLSAPNDKCEVCRMLCLLSEPSKQHQDCVVAQAARLNDTRSNQRSCYNQRPQNETGKSTRRRAAKNVGALGDQIESLKRLVVI